MIADELVSALRERGQTVAVAESLTGGLICATVVEVPGASAVLRGGVVAYATELKHRLLDVDAGLLARNGPVDPDVAAQMALGVRERLGADWGLASTGVAGPDAQGDAPVGRVYLAVAGPLVSLPEAGIPAGPGDSLGSGEGVPEPGPDDVADPLPAASPGLIPPIGTRVLELDLTGDRAAVRTASADQALSALLAALREVDTSRGAEHDRSIGR